MPRGAEHRAAPGPRPHAHYDPDTVARALGEPTLPLDATDHVLAPFITVDGRIHTTTTTINFLRHHTLGSPNVSAARRLASGLAGWLDHLCNFCSLVSYARELHRQLRPGYERLLREKDEKVRHLRTVPPGDDAVLDAPAGIAAVDLAWQDRFDFRTHWGTHALDALRAFLPAGYRGRH